MTRARLLARSFVLAFVFLGPAVAASCGGSSTDKPAPAATGGAMGTAGMASTPQPITCGALTCDPLLLPFPPNSAAACCASGDVCGIDASPLAAYGVMFADPCQAKNQAGDPDAACPMSPPITVTIANKQLNLTFPGCCHTDTHACGYQLDKLGGLFELGFGCVDSAPFLEGGAASPCGAGGAAGASN